MSCGDNHEVDCSEILGHLYEYIDNELADADCASIRTHLDECSPCLDKYGLEQQVKELVHRCCGRDEVPTELRSKVLERIKLVRVEVDAQRVSVEETVVRLERPGSG
jgi:anti-sigma factor (TIGR02949 family)